MKIKHNSLIRTTVPRRLFLSKAAQLAMTTVAFFSVGEALSMSAAAKPLMTPQVKLVEDYNNWFISSGAYKGDIETLKAGLPRYITNEAILNEAISLPWGGTMVGYNGWIRLCQISAPIWSVIAPNMTMSGEHYYQKDNVVLHEVTVTITPTDAAPVPFTMGILEKYTIANGRIRQIDEFYSDTAGFLQRLGLLGALPSGRN